MSDYVMQTTEGLGGGWAVGEGKCSLGCCQCFFFLLWLMFSFNNDTTRCMYRRRCVSYQDGLRLF